jgi:hypothetical protein
VPSHADPSVDSLPVDTLSHNFRYALLQTLPALSKISLHPFPFAVPLPVLDWMTNCHSNPIAQRVRRKRQRLPPSLLIENASGLISRPPHNYLPEAFPIKASDHSSRIATVSYPNMLKVVYVKRLGEATKTGSLKFPKRMRKLRRI